MVRDKTLLLLTGEIKKGDWWKTVFLTNKELFKLKEIYFELYNLFGTFQ